MCLLTTPIHPNPSSISTRVFLAWTQSPFHKIIQPMASIMFLFLSRTICEVVFYFKYAQVVVFHMEGVNPTHVESTPTKYQASMMPKLDFLDSQAHGAQSVCWIMVCLLSISTSYLSMNKRESSFTLALLRSWSIHLSNQFLTKKSCIYDDPKCMNIIHFKDWKITTFYVVISQCP